MDTRRKLLTPGTVVGVVALVFAISGAAFAGSKIGTSDIEKGAVTKPKLAKRAVRGGKIDTAAVKKAKIAEQAVATDKLADGAVSTGKLADGAVSTGKLETGAVSTDRISDGAVSNSKLAHPIYWGLVDATIPPSLVRASGATAAIRIAAGNYRVEFAAPIDACSYQATPADVSDNLTAAAEVDVTNPQRVFVSLRNAATGTRTDGDFNLAAHC